MQLRTYAGCVQLFRVSRHYRIPCKWRILKFSNY